MTFNFIRVAPLAPAATAALLALLAPAPAQATPRPLPFTYPVQTLPEGATEVEAYVDMTPLRVEADPADTTKGRLWEPAYKLQTELEYGIADRWELGFYQVFEAAPLDGGGNAVTFDGLKGRVRTRFADAGEWPVDVGVYLEVALLHDELELEAKVLLEKRFGKLRLLSNLWVEESFDRPYDSAAQGRQASFWVNPTLGGTYEVATRVQLGLEGWARGRLDKIAGAPNDSMRVYAGPTLHYNMGRSWISVGGYLQATDVSKPLPGEVNGPFWLRTVVGVDL